MHVQQNFLCRLRALPTLPCRHVKACLHVLSTSQFLSGGIFDLFDGMCKQHRMVQKTVTLTDGMCKLDLKEMTVLCNDRGGGDVYLPCRFDVQT